MIYKNDTRLGWVGIFFFAVTSLSSAEAAPSKWHLFSFDGFAHYSFRSKHYTFSGGADWKPVIPFIIGSLRPFVGGFVARSSKFYAVAEAGAHLEFGLGNFSLFVGPNAGVSFERKVSSDSMLFGPSAGVSYEMSKDYALFGNLVVYPSDSGMTTQIRVGLSLF